MPAASAPPWNREAEQSVIGAVLLRNETIRRATIAPEDFFDKRHHLIWRAMLALDRRGSPIDPVLIETELAAEFHVVGHVYMSSCVGIVPTADNIEFYVALVRETAITRRVQLALSDLLHCGLEGADLLRATTQRLAFVTKQQAEAAPDTRAYGLTMTDLLADEDDEDDYLDWRIRGFIPSDGPGVIAGEPKSKKTWLAEHLAVSMAAGVPNWLDRPEFSIRPGRVLFLALEDHVKVTRRRIRRLSWGMGLDPRGLENLRIEPNLMPFRFDKERDLGCLRRTLDAWRPDWIIVDSLTKTHQVDENSVKEMAPVLEAWEGLCRDYSCAVSALHHLNKPNQTNAKARLGNRMRGTSSLFAFVRYLVFVEKTDEQHSALEVEGNMLFKPDPFTIEIADGVTIDGKSTTTLRHVGTAAAAAAMAMSGPILALLEDGPASASAIAKELRKRKADVLHTLRTLADARLVRNEDRLWKLHKHTS